MEKLDNKTDSQFQPEVGQFLFASNYNRYECPEFVEALVKHLLDKLSTAYWNVYQKQWNDYADFLEWDFMEYRPFRYPEFDFQDLDCGNCNQSEYEQAQKDASYPNLKFEDVEICWYKHIGRGMSVNVEKSEAEWVGWFNRFGEQIFRKDHDSFVEKTEGYCHYSNCEICKKNKTNARRSD